MNKQGRIYSYEKEIKFQRDRANKYESDLIFYKNVCSDIFVTMTGHLMENKNTNQGWILAQFKRLWK